MRPYASSSKFQSTMYKFEFLPLQNNVKLTALEQWFSTSFWTMGHLSQKISDGPLCYSDTS